MEIENLIRYTALAVGLKPSASQGEARLRGLYRIIYSKTMSRRRATSRAHPRRNPRAGLEMASLPSTTLLSATPQPVRRVAATHTDTGRAGVCSIAQQGSRV